MSCESFSSMQRGVHSCRRCALPPLTTKWLVRRVLRLAAPLSAFMALRALSSAMLQA